MSQKILWGSGSSLTNPELSSFQLVGSFVDDDDNTIDDNDDNDNTVNDNDGADNTVDDNNDDDNTADDNDDDDNTIDGNDDDENDDNDDVLLTIHAKQTSTGSSEPNLLQTADHHHSSSIPKNTPSKFFSLDLDQKRKKKSFCNLCL